MSILLAASKTERKRPMAWKANKPVAPHDDAMSPFGIKAHNIMKGKLSKNGHGHVKETFQKIPCSTPTEQSVPAEECAFCGKWSEEQTLDERAEFFLQKYSKTTIVPGTIYGNCSCVIGEIGVFGGLLIVRGHLPGQVVTLTIPEKALESSQTIYIVVDFQKCQSSPRVKLGPSGTKFRKSVVLTFPSQGSEEVCLYKRPDEKSEWLPEEELNIPLITHHGKCLMELWSFSDYQLSPPDSIPVCLRIYRQLGGTGDGVSIRVYIVKHSPGSDKTLEQREYGLLGERCKVRDFFLRRNHSVINVNCNDGLTALEPPATKEVNKTWLRENHEFCGAFIFKTNSTAAHPALSVVVDGVEYNIIVALPPTDALSPEMRAVLAMDRVLNPVPQPNLLLTTKLVEELSSLIDSSPLTRRLAENAHLPGCNPIPSDKILRYGGSPTRLILHFFQCLCLEKSLSQKEALHDLCHVLETSGLEIAADIVKNYISAQNRDPQENSDEESEKDGEFETLGVELENIDKQWEIPGQESEKPQEVSEKPDEKSETSSVELENVDKESKNSGQESEKADEESAKPEKDLVGESETSGEESDNFEMESKKTGQESEKADEESAKLNKKSEISGEELANNDEEFKDSGQESEKPDRESETSSGGLENCDMESKNLVQESSKPDEESVKPDEESETSGDKLENFEKGSKNTAQGSDKSDEESEISSAELTNVDEKSKTPDKELESADWVYQNLHDKPRLSAPSVPRNSERDSLLLDGNETDIPQFCEQSNMAPDSEKSQDLHTETETDIIVAENSPGLPASSEQSAFMRSQPGRKTTDSGFYSARSSQLEQDPKAE